MHTRHGRQGGQIIVLFSLALVVILLAVGLSVDAGYAWAQRRSAQNAADLSALAAARIVGQNLCVSAGNCAPGFVSRTDQDVVDALNKLNGDNGGQPIAYGSTANGPRYVDSSGAPLAGVTSWVANGTIPAGAHGVSFSATRHWRPFLLGVVGISGWDASAAATAKSGWNPPSASGDLLPIAVDWSTSWQVCPEGTPAASCPNTPLSPLGNTNKPQDMAPGQFGWMAWPGVGLNAPDLANMLNYPTPVPGYAPPPYSVPANGYVTIGGNTGVSDSIAVRNQIQNWVASGATVLVPIISPGTGNYPGTTIPYPPSVVGNGSHAQYNVIGFAGFQLTGCTNPCIDHLQGVFRQAFFLGPTVGTAPSPGSVLGVELVR